MKKQMVCDAKECTLPRIPEGMYPDETYGDQCASCVWGAEMPEGIMCTFEE